MYVMLLTLVDDRWLLKSPKYELLSRLRISSFFFFFSSRRRHTRSDRDWSSDVCSSDLGRNPCPGRHRSIRRARLISFRPRFSISFNIAGDSVRLAFFGRIGGNKADDDITFLNRRARVRSKKQQSSVGFEHC